MRVAPMLTVDEMRARYEAMPVEALLALWAKPGRTTGIEAMLQDVLLARGATQAQLDDLRLARPTLRTRIARPRASDPSGRSLGATGSVGVFLVFIAAFAFQAIALVLLLPMPASDDKGFVTVMMLATSTGGVLLLPLLLVALAVLVGMIAVAAICALLYRRWLR
jgi:hypothetical protein